MTERVADWKCAGCGAPGRVRSCDCSTNCVYVRTEDGELSIRDKIFQMSAGGRDTQRCLFFHGPTRDGDVPSKAGRDELVREGYAERWNGWQWLTEKGVKHAIEVMLLDGEKDKWQRHRSGAR